MQRDWEFPSAGRWQGGRFREGSPDGGGRDGLVQGSHVGAAQAGASPVSRMHRDDDGGDGDAVETSWRFLEDDADGGEAERAQYAFELKQNLSSVLNDPRGQSDAYYSDADCVVPPLPDVPVVSFDADFKEWYDTFRDCLSSNQQRHVVTQTDTKVNVNLNDPASASEYLGVPELYFRDTFNLQDRETFETACGRQFESIVLSQQRLSHWTDAVEVQLTTEISRRSRAFFAALDNIRVLHSRITDAVEEIHFLRKRISLFEHEVIQKGLCVPKLRRRGQSLAKVSKMLQLMQMVRDSHTCVTSLLQQKRYTAALDLLNASEEVMVTELRGITCFRQLREKLQTTLETVEEHMMDDFVAITQQVNDLGEQDGQLVPMMISLLRLERMHCTWKPLRDGFGAQVQAVIASMVSTAVADVVSASQAKARRTQSVPVVATSDASSSASAANDSATSLRLVNLPGMFKRLKDFKLRSSTDAVPSSLPDAAAVGDNASPSPSPAPSLAPNGSEVLSPEARMSALSRLRHADFIVLLSDVFDAMVHIAVRVQALHELTIACLNLSNPHRVTRRNQHRHDVIMLEGVLVPNDDGMGVLVDDSDDSGGVVGDGDDDDGYDRDDGDDDDNGVMDVHESNGKGAVTGGDDARDDHHHTSSSSSATTTASTSLADAVVKADAERADLDAQQLTTTADMDDLDDLEWENRMLSGGVADAATAPPSAASSSPVDAQTTSAHAHVSSSRVDTNDDVMGPSLMIASPLDAHANGDADDSEGSRRVVSGGDGDDDPRSHEEEGHEEGTPTAVSTATTSTTTTTTAPSPVERLAAQLRRAQLPHASPVAPRLELHSTGVGGNGHVTGDGDDYDGAAASPEPAEQSNAAAAAHAAHAYLSTCEPLALPASYRSQLASDSLDMLHHVSDVQHARCAQLIRSRADVHVKLNLGDFKQLFDVSFGFIRLSERLCGKQCYGLRGQLMEQAKQFVAGFHRHRLNVMKRIMESETWQQADVAVEFQQLSDIMQSDGRLRMADAASVAVGDSSDRDTRALVVDGETFRVVGCVLIFVKQLAEYLEIIDGLPQLWGMCLLRVVKFMQFFNAETADLILGAKAMRIAKLKSISARHLALAAQSVGLLLQLSPHLREYMRARMEDGKQGFYLKHFDQVVSDCTAHRSNIFDKFIAIMQNVLRSLVESLHLQVMQWAASPASVSKYAKQLVTETTKMHAVLVRYLPPRDLCAVFQRIFHMYNQLLRAKLASLSLPTRNLRKRLGTDVRHIVQSLNALNVSGCSMGMQLLAWAAQTHGAEAVGLTAQEAQAIADERARVQRNGSPSSVRMNGDTSRAQ